MSAENSSQAAATAVAGQSTDAVIAERGRTHGDYPEMARVQSGLHDVLLSSPGWSALPPPIRVFLLSTIQKLSRIVSGNPREPDHYRDIGGYARLAEKSLDPTVISTTHISELSTDKLLVGTRGQDLQSAARQHDPEAAGHVKSYGEIAIPCSVLDGICTAMRTTEGEESVIVRDSSGQVRLHLGPRGLKIYNERGTLVLSSSADGVLSSTEMSDRALPTSGPFSIRTGGPSATGGSSGAVEGERGRHPPAELIEIVVGLQTKTEALGLQLGLDSDERSRSRERIADATIDRILCMIDRRASQLGAEMNKAAAVKISEQASTIRDLRIKIETLAGRLSQQERVIDRLTRD